MALQLSTEFVMANLFELPDILIIRKTWIQVERVCRLCREWRLGDDRIRPLFRRLLHGGNILQPLRYGFLCGTGQRAPVFSGGNQSGCEGDQRIEMPAAQNLPYR